MILADLISWPDTIRYIEINELDHKNSIENQNMIIETSYRQKF